MKFKVVISKHNMHSKQCLQLHVDSHPFANARTNIFGHQNSMITFKEGLLAKKLDILEYKFYEANLNEFQKSNESNLNGLIPDFHCAIVIFRKSLNQAQKQLENSINKPIKTHKNELLSLGYKNYSSSAYLNAICDNPKTRLKSLSFTRSETILDTSTITSQSNSSEQSNTETNSISNFKCQYYQNQNPYVESEEEKARKLKKKVKKAKKQKEAIIPLYDNEEVFAYVVDNAEDLIDEDKLITQLNSKYRLHLSQTNKKTKLPESDWKSLLINGKSSILDSLFVLQDDISVKAGLSWPVSTLDVKVGTRTWRLNASQKKSQRRANRIARGPNGDFKFRIRAAVYLPEDSTTNTFMAVTREFTDCCNRNEVISVLKSFFKYKDQIPIVIQKLEKMRNSIIVLENQYKVRFYSSSIVFMYNDQAVVDADRDTKSNNKKGIIECRLLDFEKAYVHIDQEASKFNIPLEKCGDGVVDAFNNFINLLKTF